MNQRSALLSVPFRRIFRRPQITYNEKKQAGSRASSSCYCTKSLYRNMSSTSALFEPLQLGDITIKNRIGFSALTRDRAVGTIPNDVMKEYYVQRATAGLIVTEGTLITRQG